MKQRANQVFYCRLSCLKYAVLFTVFQLKNDADRRDQNLSPPLKLVHGPDLLKLRKEI